jgi:protease IV
MTNDIERYFEKAKLRKKLWRWRIFGVLAALVALAVIFGRGESSRHGSDHIARLEISGLITGDDRTLKLIKDIRDSKTAKALIVRIDSPGGTTAGSEAIYEELRLTAAEKPIVAVMDSVAASGGYITALATDRIVARGNTLTGSIGVIFSYPEVSKLLDTIGVKMEELKSGDMKAEPNGYRPITEKARSVSQAMVQDSFEWFLGLVAERRKMPDAKSRALADGRAFTGRQALREGLIDEIGGEREALTWLAREKKIDETLDVETWRTKSPVDPLLFGFESRGWLGRALGIDAMTDDAQRALSHVNRDGLWAIWQPAL